jgi:hypothetical protein
MSDSRRFLILRALLAAALAACAYQAARQGLAAAYFRHPTPERIEQAIRLDPGRPQYHAALARVRQYAPDADLGEVIRHYEAAVARSPRQADYWADLADTYELAGRLADAERAYERARAAAPNSPTVGWQRGNFLLRRGQVAAALEAFRPVLLARPELRRQAFDLAWHATSDSGLILERMIPPRVEIALEYLNYLVAQQRLEAAGELWSQLLAWNQPFDPRAAFPFLDALREHGEPEGLEAAWGELGARHPLGFPRRAAPDELITNGGFESDLWNGGLDWRVVPVEGAVVSVDNLNFFEGTRALRLEFDGRHNLDYRHVSQYVPVRPGESYRFSYFIRTQGLTSDSGPRFELADAYDPARLSVTTRNVLGSARWSLEQVEFTAGAGARLLTVRLIRPSSQKLDNRLGGTVWIDQVSLTALPARRPEKPAREATPVPH